MKKPKNYYEECVRLFSSLKKEFPNISIAKHIATAFSAYKDIYSISDKQFYDLLLEYRSLIEMDNGTFDVNKMEKEAMCLYNILEEDEE